MALMKPKNVATSIACPTVRIVAIEVCAEDSLPGGGYRFSSESRPVVAVRSAIKDDGGEPEEDPIVWDWEMGFVTLEDLQCSNTIWQLVVCTWAPEEDSERFKTVISRMEAELEVCMDEFDRMKLRKLAAQERP